MNAPDGSLPAAPPFRLRARVLTPLAAGGTQDLDDGLIDVAPDGRIARVVGWEDAGRAEPSTDAPAHRLADSSLSSSWQAPEIDLRPWLVLPGLVDLHAHIPQLGNAGIGYGLDLLTWLERYTFPTERRYDAETAERLAPFAFEAFAAAGTTTVVGYVTADPAATDAVFRAAEASGLRAILGLVLMESREQAGPAARLGVEGLEASEDLCRRWDGRDAGRLRYAFTPRFALSCSATVLRESVLLADAFGAYWQTHLAEDRREIAAVHEAFPEARDYLDVYERAGALDRGTGPGARPIFAHAIHLSEREVNRLADAGAAVAHCPSSNLFLPSGIMPLGSHLAAGLVVGVGSDVSGGPDPSLFEVMRVGAYAQHALQSAGGMSGPLLDPLGWLRLGTLDGARALGLADRIGSIEAGKEADFIAVDPAAIEPYPGAGGEDSPEDVVSRLMFRTQRGMVRAGWVRGRRILPVPGQPHVSRAP